MVCLLACGAAGAFFFLACQHARRPADAKKMIILGIDGLDPDLLTRFMSDGKMPNFARLVEQGSFRRLTTSIPPQSPVAWSNLITGMDAGGHGVFDFIHRDPKTLQLYFSTSKVEGPAHSLHLGKWVIPLGSGSAAQLRHGAAFWEILDEHHVQNFVYRIPANFPPIDAKGKTLSGMGTPDLRGTYGTFTFYTDDPAAAAGAVEGGEIVQVEVKDDRVRSNLIGPDNAFLKNAPPSTEPFTVDVDPLEAVARIEIQRHQLVLKEGEWSGWLPVEFDLMPLIGKVRGICRFYLKQAHPRFQLYVSPINIDPENPALPISTPSSYSRDLAQQIGEYYTQGIAEDTKARMASVLDDEEFLAQSRSVLAEHRRAFDAEFPKFRDGLFFFYFSSLDLNGHMLWRLSDPESPSYDKTESTKYGTALEEFYEQIDQVLGEVLPTIDERTTLLVLSDHGFAPYRRSFNLNTWLLSNGYIVRKRGASDDASTPFADVDWSRTRAYGIGLNGLYLNLKGREKEGIVEPSQGDGLLREISGKLLGIRDPKGGLPVITRVDMAKDAYSGPYAHSGPDALVGYNRGYRSGWKTILGGFPPDVLEDNTSPWSGDHCMDFTKVPGVLLSNRKNVVDAPALTDIAPTILAEYGIAKTKEMKGRSVFEAR
jgi:predicted AlkP superfamily phosphohydrolase/phosphomutase